VDVNNPEETTILAETESVCPECLARIPAWRIARNGNVTIFKACPDHGKFETILWRGEPDYSSWVRPKIPSYPANPFTTIDRGCPYDCGLCPDHRQHTCTALLEVTQRCDLGCPFCFASSVNRESPDPPLPVIESWYRSLLKAGGPFNVQLSGGEPCLRDDLPEIVNLGRSLGFEFIQVNTNGIRLSSEPGYLYRLADNGLASVFMQFDGTNDDIYRVMRGRPLLDIKRTAIERCAEAGLGVILVPTVVPGINADNLGDIIHFAIQYAPAVRGVHFQPVSYFGRYPKAPTDQDRITVPEIIRSLESQSGGLVSHQAFKPSGCENAFCSFHGNFVLMPDDKLIPWTKHNPTTNCCCQPEIAAEGATKTREFTARYWSSPDTIQIISPDVPIKTQGLGGWDLLLERVRTHTFTISGMAFQDAWTLDLERLRDCCIHTVSPDGRIIPFCAYNLTSRQGKSLYRNNGKSA
jgi:uncharacterized radical SAM superfamily Fe-S cluster-containing enzyme